jgi:hypothetical protein
MWFNYPYMQIRSPYGSMNETSLYERHLALLNNSAQLTGHDSHDSQA